MAFGLFVGLGSSVLILWLHLTSRRDALQHFAESARTNARFVRDARLPASERTADALSRVLGVAVTFASPGDAVPPIPLLPDPSRSEGFLRRCQARPGEAVRWSGFEGVLMPVSERESMWFVRREEGLAAALFQPRALWAVAIFWVLALTLAAALARGIIQPLRRLAEQLPQIESEPSMDFPGTERHDEIGLLARAYVQTRHQLAEERVAREKSERLALLGRMATGLAHEIHNPVAAIRMHTQLLQSTEPAALRDAAAETLPILVSEIARIESLVNQWMFLARPEPPRKSATDLAAVVRAVVAAHAGNARYAGVEVSSEVQDDMIVEADSRRLHQAASNVVVNAIQAMPEGGRLRIGGEKNAHAIRLWFRDDGMGFSGDALLRHSELFYSEKEGGMGMGLSVANEVLKAHGGSLRVENAAPAGAVVSFEFPAV